MSETESHRNPTRVNETSAGQTTGHLFIVSAPSGAGKSTLCEAVRRQFPKLAYSISYTTRPPRSNERHGRDYFFITVEEFKKGIAEGRWAEWAKVHKNYYGSSARWIQQTLQTGGDILMDIDLQGARQMLRRFPDAITVFIMPPSMEELERRLCIRGTESRETIALRLANAKEEIARKDVCRYSIVNDDLEKATRELAALVGRYLDATVSPT